MSSERQLGPAGLGPIPWSAILKYSTYYGYVVSEMSQVISALDLEFMNYYRPKAS